MTAPPRVSVIIPSHNYARYLPEALASVIAQTMTEWECIVVDDGSTDETPSVLESYVARDRRIRALRLDGRGPAAARNAGVRASTGAYLQFLDADDLLAPAKLEVHAEFLDRAPDVDIVYGISTYFRTSEPDRVLYSLRGQLSRPLLAPVQSGAEALRLLQMFNIMPVCSVLARRGVWMRIGGFNEAARGTEDWDFWLRAAIAGCELRYFEDERARPRIRIHSVSASQDNAKMMQSVVNAALTFRGAGGIENWSAPALPLVYEVAAGIDDVRGGRRGRAVRRIVRAALGASSTLTRLRWLVYGAGAALLPRGAFWWLVTRPMPEWGLELLRRVSGAVRRRRPESRR
jgi:glycosyltransferase involved in cell wall biosynthesis